MDRLIHGDCLPAMRELPSCSVDAIVTDPPYGLEFLGKDWDYGVPGPVYWQEALRVAKPGAHLLAFGGTRTFHRLACNIEDAGWEIRDCLLWLYSGFPKGTNLEKAISKTDPELGKEWHGFNTQLKPGYEPIIMGRKPTKDSLVRNVMEWGVGGLNVEGCKVGSEVVSYGPKKSVDSHAFEPKEGKHVIKRSGFAGSTHVGRWPTNVIMDEGVAADLDREVGRSVSRYYYCYKAGGEERQEVFMGTCTIKLMPDELDISQLCLKKASERAVTELRRATSGLMTVSLNTGGCGVSISAQCQWDSLSTILTAIRRTIESRTSPSSTPSPTSDFTADASLSKVSGGSPAESVGSSKRSQRTTTIPNTTESVTEYVRGVNLVVSRTLSKLSESANWQKEVKSHCTVKPVALMRYLCRLVTPPGGLVLDPFCGSGSTLVAAKAERLHYIGMDIMHEYIATAEKRLAIKGRLDEKKLVQASLDLW
jgi:DNA modification methylase